MVSFKVGDNAVYPNHGVGRIAAIETKELGGASQAFYIIEFLDNDTKIMVPTDKAESRGVRAIISKAEADKVLALLKRTDVKIDNQTWNRRYREYLEKIKTGSVYEIAEVLRDLYLLKVEKELSFGERTMLEKARRLLLNELSLATGKEELQNATDVAAIFGI